MKKPLRRRTIAFTLIELLTVIAIIAILASLVLAAGSGVMQKAARSRAAGEIQAMSTVLESYKVDNGIYPPSDSSLTTNSYIDTSSSLSTYKNASTMLFTNLAGMNYYGQGGLNKDTSGNNVKSYMSFKANQIGNPNGPLSYVKDPWGNPYGYSTGDNATPTEAASPYNGQGFFDLWSTGGLTGTGAAGAGNTNAWISNWQ